MKIWTKAALAILVAWAIALAPGPVLAGKVLDGADSQVRLGGVDMGAPVFDDPDNPGWKPSMGGDFETGGAEYLYFDLASTPINTSEGAVTATLVRGNVSDHEMVFGFADESWDMLWGFQIHWENAITKGVDQEVLLYQRRAQPAARSNLGFPAVLSRGEQFSVGFAWKAGAVSVVLNGQDLGARAGDVEGFIRMLERARYLVVGAETESQIVPDGAFSTLGSRLVDFAVYDSYGNLFRADLPVITGVSHDAFAKAGYSGKLVAGDTYTVTLKAEPGGTAAFDLGPVKGHPLTESADTPGIYTGVHTVVFGESVENGRVVGHFTDTLGLEAEPVAAARLVTVDAAVHFEVNPSNDLVPADEDSRAGITVVATDANGKAVRSHPLILTLSTTDEYTGILGGVNFEDAVGGTIEVDWGGVTDSFGEVTAQYVSGFAAKTILVSAKDMTTGDVGVGWVRSYIDGTVDIVVKKPAVRSLAVTGSMKVSVSRDWLTADGRSRSRVTAVVKDMDGNPMKGNQISFNLLSSNGSIRQIQSRTDSRGRAFADYIAGTVIGQVQIEVRDMTSGLVAVVSIELRPDAPAEISLTADPGEVFIGDTKGSQVTAKVTDVNGNPNTNTDVLFEVIAGEGAVSAPKVATDDRDGIAAVTFLPGNNPGVVTVKATVMSREPTVEELEAARGAVFLYGLDEDPGRLDVLEWLAGPGGEVVEGQDLVILEDRRGDTYTVKAPRDGTLSVFTAEERDRVEYGQTLGYVLPLPE